LSDVFSFPCFLEPFRKAFDYFSLEKILQTPHHLRQTETPDVSRFSRRQLTVRFSATPTFQNLFEILIFFSLDSNDGSALYP